MLTIRKLHAYLGLLIAPSVVFFAFSGALQLFNLHEAHGRYKPPAILSTLGNVHKDQVLSEPDEDHHAPPPPAAAGKAEPTGPEHNDDAPKIKTYVLKWVFAVVAAGLLASTVMGLWIALRFTRTPRLSWGLLIAGAVVPLLLLII